MEQTGNSFGFASTEVDTHMSKNNEWGAVAYLTQSIYGRCSGVSACMEISKNNNNNCITGIGAEPTTATTSSVTNTYDTTLGMGASTTGNIYGIYDMNGGTYEFVMGNYNKTISSSGFSSLPDEKYYNNYTTTTYQGHALTETAGWYSDYSNFIGFSYPWIVRSYYFSTSYNSGIFYYENSVGSSGSGWTSRMVITNE